MSLENLPKYTLKNVQFMPWLVWLSGLSISLWNKMLLVPFLVRAHAWVAVQGPIWGQVRGNCLMYLSHINVRLPLSLLSKNKISKKNLKMYNLLYYHLFSGYIRIKYILTRSGKGTLFPNLSKVMYCTCKRYFLQISETLSPLLIL